MPKTTILVGLLILALAALVVRPAFTEEEKGPSPDEIMAWYGKMGQPGEHHKWMDFMQGNWTVGVTMWMEPGEGQESEARCTNEWVLGKHHMECKFVGEFMGQAFHGRGIVGFNNASEEYEQTWIDNSSTWVSLTKGKREGDEVTFLGKEPSPSGALDTRSVLKRVGPDAYTWTSYRTIPGLGEMKGMELRYTRAK